MHKVYKMITIPTLHHKDMLRERMSMALTRTRWRFRRPYSSVRTTDFAFEEQMAKRYASWEIDSKASIPQASYDSTTNGTQTQASSSHLASFEQCFLCSVVRAAASACCHTRLQNNCGNKRICDRQVKSCWPAQDPI